MVGTFGVTPLSLDVGDVTAAVNVGGGSLTGTTTLFLWLKKQQAQNKIESSVDNVEENTNDSEVE